MLNRSIHLTVQNNYGSVQHYYHFLLGLLAPLVRMIDMEVNSSEPHTKFLIRSCGPMDRHLLALNFKNVQIVRPTFHHKIGSVGRIVPDRFLSHKSIVGLDSQHTFDGSKLREAALAIRKRLETQIIAEKETWENNSRIVLIKRTVDAFYNTKESERKKSGAQRRSIPNFAQLEDHLRLRYPHLKTLVLERKGLAYQIAHVENADIVIAQHGAALANLIFAKEGTRVIEINPQNPPRQNFVNLSKSLNLDYQSYPQESKHAEVNVNEIGKLCCDS